jgi:hypothetical protein
MFENGVEVVESGGVVVEFEGKLLGIGLWELLDLREGVFELGVL